MYPKFGFTELGVWVEGDKHSSYFLNQGFGFTALGIS